MLRRRARTVRALAAFLALGISALCEAAAAQESKAGGGSAAHSSALGTERARLRQELDRVNAEIDALKRADGLRDDYRLRARLADADALARRLVEIEARLGIKAGPASAPLKPATVPVASPTDGPAELEAKADILADQSRRFRLQAEALGKRAQDVKGRQDLRRRVADLDRDPFGPMEGSKRRVASALPGIPMAERAPNPMGSGSGAGPVGPPSQPTDLGPGITAGGTQGGTTFSTPPMPTVSTAGAVMLSVQLRDLLDTTTLADIRRLERSGTAGASAQALERAAAALRTRAADFDTRARAMRDEARGRLHK
jgi:hypothetical protein